MFKGLIEKVVKEQVETYLKDEFEKEMKEAIKWAVNRLFYTHWVDGGAWQLSHSEEGLLVGKINEVVKTSISDKIETLTKHKDFIEEMVKEINKFQLGKG